MEGPKELTERIESDVDKILKMYQVAEKAYSYENVHGPRTDLETVQRFNTSGFNSAYRPIEVFNKGSLFPFLFMFAATRPGASGLLELRESIAKKPARAVGFYLLGAGLVSLYRLNALEGQLDAKDPN